MAAKLLILCVILGAVTARCNQEGTKLGLAKCVEQEIYAVDDLSRNYNKTYSDLLYRLNYYDRTEFRDQLLTSINQTANILESEKSDIELLKNGSILIENISRDARKCITGVKKKVHDYHAKSQESLAKLTRQLEEVQKAIDNGRCDVTVLWLFVKEGVKGECQKQFDDIADRVGNIFVPSGQSIGSKIRSLVSYAIGTRNYVFCLIDNSVESMMDRVKQLVMDAERILSDKVFGGEVDDEMRSKIKTLLVELGDSSLGFGREISFLDGGFL